MDCIFENRYLGVGEDGLEVASLAVDALLVGRVRVATFQRPVHGLSGQGKVLAYVLMVYSVTNNLFSLPVHGLSGQGKVLDLGPTLILIDLVVLEHHFVGFCPEVGVAPVV